MPPRTRTAGRVSRLPGRFIVEANSRHPRLGLDYNPSTHAFTDTYLNPTGYKIVIDDFPGMTLFKDNAEADQQGSDGDRQRRPDVYKLSCPTTVTGWRYTVTGRPAGKLPFGPRPPKFTATGMTHLVTTIGVFTPRRTDNAWNWHFTVPGPGTYTVTAERMVGAVVDKVSTHNMVIQDYLVVSIGDSAAAGEGLPDIPGSPEGYDPEISWWEWFIPPILLYELSAEALDWCEDYIAQHNVQLARKGDLTIDMDPQPSWQEVDAHRSLRSGHAKAARMLEDRAKGRLVTFLNFGRTGSEIPHGLIGPRTRNGRPDDAYIGNIGQIQEVVNTVGQAHIDALLIYVGVNDVGVSSTLTDLVAGDLPMLGTGDPTAARKDAKAGALANLADLPGRFNQLAVALAQLNVGQVYLTEYPTGIFDDKNGVPQHACEVFSGPKLDLSKQDAVLVKEIATAVNTEVRSAAAAHGWIYITGVAQAFAAHGFCTAERYFVHCGESLGTQGDTDGTIHPNDLGTTATAKAVAASVRKNTINKTDGRTHGGQGPRQGIGGSPAGTAGVPRTGGTARRRPAKRAAAAGETAAAPVAAPPRRRTAKRAAAAPGVG